MGGIREISDPKATQMCAESHSIVQLQSGSNKGASQAGMAMGLKIDLESPSTINTLSYTEH